MAAAKGNKYSQKYTPKMITDLCESLINFSMEDRTVHFVEFARRNKKTQSWINRMEEDYPEFKDAYETAKELLSSKLVKSSIFGDPKCPSFNGTHAMSWMRVYSKTHQKYEELRANLAKISDQTNVTADQLVRAIAEGKLLDLFIQGDKPESK